MENGQHKEHSSSKFINHGISMGCALSMVISYDLNHSVFYAILHGFCSWGYVIYYLLVY